MLVQQLGSCLRLKLGKLVGGIFFVLKSRYLPNLGYKTQEI